MQDSYSKKESQPLNGRTVSFILPNKNQKYYFFHLQNFFHSQDIQFFVFAFSPIFPLSAIAWDIGRR